MSTWLCSNVIDPTLISRYVLLFQILILNEVIRENLDAGMLASPNIKAIDKIRKMMN